MERRWYLWGREGRTSCLSTPHRTNKDVSASPHSQPARTRECNASRSLLKTFVIFSRKYVSQKANKSNGAVRTSFMTYKPTTRGPVERISCLCGPLHYMQLTTVYVPWSFIKYEICCFASGKKSCNMVPTKKSAKEQQSPKVSIQGTQQILQSQVFRSVLCACWVVWLFSSAGENVNVA